MAESHEFSNFSYCPVDYEKKNSIGAIESISRMNIITSKRLKETFQVSCSILFHERDKN